MTQRSADRIREELEQAIIAGAFADGERLDEVSLSEQFRVSRTPVREALHALSASGLVEHLPRRGAFVRYPSFRRLIAMFEVMAPEDPRKKAALPDLRHRPAASDVTFGRFS